MVTLPGKRWANSPPNGASRPQTGGAIFNIHYETNTTQSVMPRGDAITGVEVFPFRHLASDL